MKELKQSIKLLDYGLYRKDLPRKKKKKAKLKAKKTCLELYRIYKGLTYSFINR